MKSLKKYFALLVTILFISSMTSCGVAHSGCPGQDRPSYRSGGWGMTTPKIELQKINHPVVADVNTMS